MYVLLHITPYAKIVYNTDLSSTSWEQFLRAIWNAVFWAIVFILCPNKLYLWLSYCAFFFCQQQVVQFLIFWGTTILFSIMTVPVYIPTNRVYVFPFLCIQNLSFENSYSNRWKLHLIVVFGLYFSNVAFFNVRLLLWNILFRSFASFLKNLF